MACFGEIFCGGILATALSAVAAVLLCHCVVEMVSGLHVLVVAQEDRVTATWLERRVQRI